VEEAVSAKKTTAEILEQVRLLVQKAAHPREGASEHDLNDARNAALQACRLIALHHLAIVEDVVWQLREELRAATAREPSRADGGRRAADPRTAEGGRRAADPRTKTVRVRRGREPATLVDVVVDAAGRIADGAARVGTREALDALFKGGGRRR
jgi:hypothetical protein